MSPFKIIPQLTVDLVTLAMQLARLAVVVFIFYVVYRLLLDQVLDGSNMIFPLLGLWILTSYIVIPRVHRMLTGYYLPNYFVGRVRSSTGLLSDPVNLAFFGSVNDVQDAMKMAGWVKAEKLTIKSGIQTAYASLLHRSYPDAPVGTMYLFNRPQDFTYQQEVDGNPNQRHHVRFWKTPVDWYLPGGHKADWIAAATYDTHVGIKIATGQLDHFIHSDIDKERDYIIQTLEDASVTKKVEVVEHFTNAYHDRNNGGDRIKTDGSLPFIYL